MKFLLQKLSQWAKNIEHKTSKWFLWFFYDHFATTIFQIPNGHQVLLSITNFDYGLKSVCYPGVWFFYKHNFVVFTCYAWWSQSTLFHSTNHCSTAHYDYCSSYHKLCAVNPKTLFAHLTSAPWGIPRKHWHPLYIRETVEIMELFMITQCARGSTLHVKV